MRAVTALAGVVVLCAACSADNAQNFSGTISDAANRLRASSNSETAVRLEPYTTTPYVLVIYPDFRTPEDEAVLRGINDKALAFSQAGAVIAPTSEGLLTTIAVWQRGSLATFSKGFRMAAEAPKALAIVKDNGGPTFATLKKEAGGRVLITALR
jgi:hypothetical protein